MKLAIPTFGDRVSPRFDCAAQIRLITWDDGQVTGQADVDVREWSLPERIHKLEELGVETLICGGIDRWSADSLAREGIQVYGWVSGSIAESLEAFGRGELQAATGYGAGQGGCRRRGQGRRRGRGSR